LEEKTGCWNAGKGENKTKNVKNPCYIRSVIVAADYRVQFVAGFDLCKIFPNPGSKLPQKMVPK